MSNRKRNVAYIKPQEPSFLTKLKKEAGYVEGPTVDTKREELPYDSGSDDERTDENPVIVVLKPGDLTAEEVSEITTKKEAEKANEPADLSQRVIFQRPAKSKRTVVESDTDKKKSSKRSKKDMKKPLLSFDEGEEDE